MLMIRSSSAGRAVCHVVVLEVDGETGSVSIP